MSMKDIKQATNLIIFFILLITSYWVPLYPPRMEIPLWVPASGDGHVPSIKWPWVYIALVRSLLLHTDRHTHVTYHEDARQMPGK